MNRHLSQHGSCLTWYLSICRPRREWRNKVPVPMLPSARFQMTTGSILPGASGRGDVRVGIFRRVRLCRVEFPAAGRKLSGPRGRAERHGGTGVPWLWGEEGAQAMNRMGRGLRRLSGGEADAQGAGAAQRAVAGQSLEAAGAGAAFF